MSNRSRGQALERKAQKELEAENWIVQRAPPSYKWSKQNDLFGLFDFICLKRDLFIFRKYIQIKSNRLPTVEEKRRLIDFKEKYCVVNSDAVEWWTWWSRGKRKIKKNGWEKITI